VVIPLEKKNFLGSKILGIGQLLVVHNIIDPTLQKYIGIVIGDEIP
jgi:hypothetical protein